MVDERVIINAMSALLATGGSTNHLIHWVAIARAAGIVIDWSDFHDLAKSVPLLASVYPNGKADVNEFQKAGGPAFVIRELIQGGCMYPDVITSSFGGIAEYAKKPILMANSFKNAVISSAAQPPNSGNYLARIEPHDGSIYQVIDVEPGEKYELKFYHFFSHNYSNQSCFGP